MFNPNQVDVRNFFFGIIDKNLSNIPLSDLEKIAYSVILEHPEYHPILHNKQKYKDYQWTVNMGQTNPFLHLSMHMSIIEQLSINQPFGINALYNEACVKFGDSHLAIHELMDCLAEMLWFSQRNSIDPDMHIYFSCINKKLKKE